MNTTLLPIKANIWICKEKINHRQAPYLICGFEPPFSKEDCVPPPPLDILREAETWISNNVHLEPLCLYRDYGFQRLQRYIPHMFSQIMSGIKGRRIYLHDRRHQYDTSSIHHDGIFRHNDSIILMKDLLAAVSNSNGKWGSELLTARKVMKKSGAHSRTEAVESNIRDNQEGAGSGKRECQLHTLIWRAYIQLRETRKTLPTAQDVWYEIQHRHENHDTEDIIVEVTVDMITWISKHGVKSSLKRSSFDKTLSMIKKNPPILLPNSILNDFSPTNHAI